MRVPFVVQGGRAGRQTADFALAALLVDRVDGAFSRETLLLANNVLLVVASVSVLLGTLYPLLVDALSLGKISVGPAHF